MRLESFLGSVRYAVLLLPAFGLLTCIEVGCTSKQADDFGSTHSNETAGKKAPASKVYGGDGYGDDGYGYGGDGYGYGGDGYGGYGDDDNGQ